jgi:hypothetical protein
MKNAVFFLSQTVETKKISTVFLLSKIPDWDARSLLEEKKNTVILGY